MNFASSLSLASAAMLLASAFCSFKHGSAGPQRRLFALAATTLAVAEVAIFLLLAASDPVIALKRARTVFALFFFFPALGFPLFLTFARRDGATLLASRMPAFVSIAIALAVAGTFLPMRFFIERIHLTEGSLWGFTLSGAGKVLSGYFLILNVLFMHLFENIYRSANVADKVTLKYPLLGMVLSTILNVAAASRVLALAELDRSLLAMHSCGVVFLCVCLIYASLRYPLFSLAIEAPSAGKPSIVSVTVAAIYLLALSIITLVAGLMDLPYNRFTMTVLGMFAVFLLLAILISGKAKRRLRTAISENFYLQRYNYRKEWRRYAEIMERSASIDDFLSNVISSLCDTMIVRKGLFWADFGAGKAGWYGFPVETLDRGLIEHLLRMTENESIIVLEKLLETPPDLRMHEDWSWVRIIARIGEGTETRGLIVLGEKDLGRSYTEEDRDFLSLIAYRAKVTLDSMLMEEKIIEERQMESFNRFASFVIHDLKNIVSMLSLTAENARTSIGSPDFQRDALETIKRSVERMQNLISSLNIRKMPTTLNRVDTDLSELAAKTLDSLKPVAAKKGLNLESHIARGVRANIDPEAVRRVIENLVFNAIEATPQEGKIEIALEMTERGQAKIEVRDNGPGFDPTYLAEHLFSPFHSTKKDGLGIGLVLCKTMTEAHGGKLTIENRASRGATVTAYFPAQKGSGD